MSRPFQLLPAAQLLRRPVVGPPLAAQPSLGSSVSDIGLPVAGNPLDRRARPLRDLRLSVTDRCNFRCGYCMPKERYGPNHPFLPRSELLSFEELYQVARVFVGLGAEKIRLTGGEPLLRSQLPRLVALLRTLDVDLAMTTNGSLLQRHAKGLAQAGLHRVTVSLDALASPAFQAMSGSSQSPMTVLDGITAAQLAGLSVKVNCVVQRGVNEDEVLPLVRYFRGRSIPLRFIEYMDVGCTNGWQSDQVVPSSELVSRISRDFPLTRLPPTYTGEVAQRFAHADGGGELGFISSVTQPFCGTCTRARLSARGMLYTCLFSERGTDLRDLLRNEGADAVRHRVTDVWLQREDRYSEQRGSGSEAQSRIEMSYIGG